MAHKPTRGERNNNPLNIKHNPANKWQGLIGADSGGFCAFVSRHYGLRAALKILSNYIEKYHVWNVELIISRWAPGCENDVEGYIKTVCRITHFDRKKTIGWNAADIVPLVQAMARVESQLYLTSDEIIAAANTFKKLN